MSGDIGLISHEQSSSIANFINKFDIVRSVNKVLKIQDTDHMVRKNAHVFEYIVLSFLISGLFFSFYKKGSAAIIYIFFICLLFSVLDEYHQSFVPGRTPLITDILIDFTSSLFGTGLFYLIYYNLYKKQFSKNKAKLPSKINPH
jgi:VanZ family protein